MEVQLGLAAGLLVAALVALTYAAGTRRARGALAAVFVVLAFAALALGVARDGVLRAGLATPDTRPYEVRHQDFVRSDSCRACHPAQYDSWYRSFHRTMTTVATPASVLGDFSGQRVSYDGTEWTLARRGDEFFVSAEGRGESRVTMTTGSHHFQAYWLETGEARKIVLFELCWRVDEDRWMPIDAAFLFPPDTRQATGDGRWNTTCSKCHSTGLRPGLSDAHAMDTHAAEFGIACEACHGPGREHVTENRDPSRRFQQYFAAGVDPTIVNPVSLSAERGSQVCAQCHAVTRLTSARDELDWSISGFRFRPGDDLEATRTVHREGREWFWPDGMIRVSGREYNGLSLSPCFTHDDADTQLACTSCHVLHKRDDDPRPWDEWRDDQLGYGMDGNAACTQCHDEYSGEAELAAHSRHAAGSAGSGCYDCHMPHTTYGLLKALRSHEVSSPSVHESTAFGRPNACNLCHLDRTLEWTAEQLAEGWGVPRPGTRDGGRALTRDEREISAAARWLLGGDAGQRALLAWHTAWEPAREASGDDWLAPFLAPLLDDPYEAVRFLGYRSLSSLPGFGDWSGDFLDAPRRRRSAVGEARAAWELRGAVGGRPALLLDAEGALDEDAWQRLLAGRDDRPVSLHE